jgi:hypothetical protein
LKEGRIDVGFGRLHFDDVGIARKVIRKEPSSPPCRTATRCLRSERL